MSTSGNVCAADVAAIKKMQKAAKRSLSFIEKEKLMAKDSQDAGSSAIAIV
jgi:hypothetical protein